MSKVFGNWKVVRTVQLPAKRIKHSSCPEPLRNSQKLVYFNKYLRFSCVIFTLKLHLHRFKSAQNFVPGYQGIPRNSTTWNNVKFLKIPERKCRYVSLCKVWNRVLRKKTRKPLILVIIKYLVELLWNLDWFGQ